MSVSPVAAVARRCARATAPPEPAVVASFFMLQRLAFAAFDVQGRPFHDSMVSR
jgi:hypothetical protein